ncbi:MAG TPA: flavodoxin family protein [Kofleriaceae bacterium]|nr:flavodoxin family protein [Kofleriaceae bacterium]
MTAIAIVYHSAGGRTKALAEAVARGVEAEGGAKVTLHAVPDIDHAALIAADAIIFGCPTYMGSASAPFKAFMDGTSTIWALQGWRDKLAAAFTHSAAPSGDKLGTLTQLAVFAAQHGMIWIGLGLPPTYAGVGGEPGETGEASETNRLGSHLGAMAQSPPGASSVPDGDLTTAELLGRRVALSARRWARGVATAGAMAAAAAARAADQEAEDAMRAEVTVPGRHPAAIHWKFPPMDRQPLPAPLERTNLRMLIARPDRFEHHLIVCATLGHTQLEIVTASEPLYFGHVAFSDEYALALPCGDPMVDRVPLRTFISDATTGADLGRYNHRAGDLVLHPVGYMHWPGRLRPPYEPFEYPPGLRRCGLSLVFCATARVASSGLKLPPPADRTADIKSYVDPPPPMVLAEIDGPAETIAQIGTTELMLIERRGRIAPTRGCWVVVLKADPASVHEPGDLIRVPAGATLDARGISRALALADPYIGPDAPPPSWQALPAPPFPPYEDAPPGALPIRFGTLTVEAARSGAVAVSVDNATAAVPRYWLARMLFRAALHELRVGYIETYGGLFIDDHPQREDGAIEIGLRTESGRVAVAIPAAEAIAVIERIYRAVAPPGYRERLR